MLHKCLNRVALFGSCLIFFVKHAFVLIQKWRRSEHKQHFCLFCKSLVWKISRHLERNHKDEEDVKKVLALGPRSKERRNAWQSIIRRGDYEVNIERLKKDGESNLLVTRSTNENRDAVPCTFCYGIFNARTIYKHKRGCFLSKGDQTVEVKSGVKSSRAFLDAAITSDENFKVVHNLLLCKMKRDVLHIVIRNDSTLLMYGVVQLKKKDKLRYADIRASLRVLAQLLSEFRKATGKDHARGKELVMCENYDLVLNAAKVVSGFQGARKIKNPYLFLKIGFCLKNLAQYVGVVALKENDDLDLKKVRNFNELYERDWQIHATNARATVEGRVMLQRSYP